MIALGAKSNFLSISSLSLILYIALGSNLNRNRKIFYPKILFSSILVLLSTSLSLLVHVPRRQQASIHIDIWEKEVVLTYWKFSLKFEDRITLAILLGPVRKMNIELEKN